MNDTGSEALTLFTTDFPYLGGNIQGYRAWLPDSNILDANGGITVFPTILVQVRLVKDDNTPWGDWVVELAVVKQPSPNLSRLSGIGIRHELYFGTPPGNNLLAVSATRGGLTSLF